MVKRLTRSEVPRELTWDLESLYSDVAAWEADLAKVDAMLPGLDRFRGRLHEGARTLLACLLQMEEVQKLARRLGWFASNYLNEDVGDSTRAGLRDRAMAMQSRVGSALSFFRPELLTLPDGTVEAYLDAESDLEVYRLMLTDIVAEKAHMLGTEAEAVLASMGELLQAPFTIWSSTTQADIKFDPVVDEKGNVIPMSLAALGKLLQSPERAVRQAAYESVNRGYAAHKRTIASAFAAAHRRDVIVARLRKYESSLEAALAPDHLPVSLFHNLLKVSESSASDLRRYIKFRQQALGLDQTMPWDLVAPLDADLKTEVSIDEAWEMILSALEPLGSDYRSILEQARRERWVDFADNQGKRQGAYSSQCYGFHPVILMTWKGELANAFTLAHELGHAAHSVLTQRTQPFVYASYSLFLAEMASTANEILLARHLLKTAHDRALRRYVLTRMIGSFMSNFWGASISAAFQLRVHEMAERGEPLTVESISAVQVEVLKRWYGDAVEVTPEYSGGNWMRVLHHFRNFYSYQYATGISAGAAFADSILREGGPAVERYLRFLSAGESAHPIDLLRAAGQDFTTPEPMQRAAALFAELVTELERT